MPARRRLAGALLLHRRFPPFLECSRVRIDEGLERRVVRGLEQRLGARLEVADRLIGEGGAEGRAEVRQKLGLVRNSPG